MNKWFALSHRTRIAIGLWIALLGGVLGRVAFDKTTAQSVLPIYLEGGRRWAEAEPLYAPMPEGLDFYRNPPLVAVLTVPFTGMPPRLAALLWRILQIGLFALGLKHFLRDVLPPLRPFQRDWFWALNAVLVLSAFNNGQLNLLLVAAALLGTAAAARRAWWVAAFWLVLAAEVKVYPIALVGLVCVGFPRPMIPRCLLLLVAGLALPMAFGGPQYTLDQYRGFAAAMQSDDRSEVPLERAPRDWTYLPRSFADVAVPRGVAMPVSAVAGLVFAGWVAFARRGERLRLAFCLGILWMLLFGPSTEMNTYSILAPVAAWLAVRPFFDFRSPVSTSEISSHGLPKSKPDFGSLAAWTAAALLVAAIVRASFPTGAFHGLGFLQPLAAALLVMTLLRRTPTHGDS
jgi:hypothetical protein